MSNNVDEIKNSIFGQYMRQEDLIFLADFYENQDKVTKEINNIEQKKKQVIEKITNDKKQMEDNPRELREYINDSESVLEAIERTYNGLDEVLNNYRNIEKNFMLIVKKSELNLEKNILEQDIYRLADLVSSTIMLETNTRKDNEKNLVIVDSFLNKNLKYDFGKESAIEFDQSNNIDFKNLTVDNLQDNLELRIYEKRVELPYTKDEILKYLETYPKNYKTVQDVISQEFIASISIFNKHPILSKFKEAYYLCRTKEMMTIFDSFNYAKSIMFRSDINAYIIAAVKSKRQLDEYINCLENNKLDTYKYFKIVYKVNPMKTKKKH